MAYRLATWFVAAAHESALYRWLTKEPEPDVIVIDLRETWTVGPIIGLLDRLIAGLAPYWQGSTLKYAFDSLVALSERAVDTRLGHLLVKFLAPPEPPDRDDSPHDE